VDKNSNSNLISSTSKLLPFYGIYIFVSGWAFLDYYYRSFGIEPRTLDIGFNDTLARGFTILFSGEKLTVLSFLSGAGQLWLAYISLAVVTLLLKENLLDRSWLKIWLAFFLSALLVWVYFVSRSAGAHRAELDKGENTRLPGITFRVGNCAYHGKLLLLRGGTYFIHDVILIGQEQQIDKNPNSRLELSVYSAQELSEVKIIGPK
jgi:hypothetical protein